MSIGFTGTREGMTSAQSQTLAQLLRNEVGEFHHGDCIGADYQAHDIAERTGSLTIVIHPPRDPRARAFKKSDHIRPKRAYLDRNHDIVDETDELVATPLTDQVEPRSGTWATIRYALRLKRPVRIIKPNGDIWKFT